MPNLNLGAVTISDDSCSPSDGFADPGETLTLNIPLSNPFCATPANGVTISVDGGSLDQLRKHPRRGDGVERPFLSPSRRRRSAGSQLTVNVAHHEQPRDGDQDVQPADRQAGTGSPPFTAAAISRSRFPTSARWRYLST